MSEHLFVHIEPTKDRSYTALVAEARHQAQNARPGVPTELVSVHENWDDQGNAKVVLRYRP